jgi:DtxR family Mn-dependent transcriptional regulator
MQLTTTEENYIKAIFHRSTDGEGNVSTNAIAEAVNSTAASVTDMLKKLKEKELIEYEKYKGVTLTAEGEAIAKMLVRKHRIWEVFLVDKLGYSWDQIHDIAEQLEHIKDKDLIDKLDKYLGYPKFDPHGDPIPDASGNMKAHKQQLLATLNKGDKGRVLGVKDSSAKFLQYLDSMDLKLGTELKVEDVIEFDGSFMLSLSNKKKVTVSKLVTQNLFVG